MSKTQKRTVRKQATSRKARKPKACKPTVDPTHLALLSHCAEAGQRAGQSVEAYQSPEAREYERGKKQRETDPRESVREVLCEIDAAVSTDDKRPAVCQGHVRTIGASRARERKDEEAKPAGSVHPDDRRPRKLLGAVDPLSLPEKYFVLAAFHDGLCKGEGMELIMPPEWRGPGEGKTFEEHKRHIELSAESGLGEYQEYMWNASEIPEKQLPVLKRYIKDVKADLDKRCPGLKANEWLKKNKQTWIEDSKDFVPVAEILADHPNGQACDESSLELVYDLYAAKITRLSEKYPLRFMVLPKGATAKDGKTKRKIHQGDFERLVKRYPNAVSRRLSEEEILENVKRLVRRIE